MGGYNSHMTVVGMGLSVLERFFRLGVVRNIDVDGHLVDAIYFLDAECFGCGFVSFEIGGFVHIEPDS